MSLWRATPSQARRPGPSLRSDARGHRPITNWLSIWPGPGFGLRIGAAHLALVTFAFVEGSPVTLDEGANVTPTISQVLLSDKEMQTLDASGAHTEAPHSSRKQ